MEISARVIFNKDFRNNIKILNIYVMYLIACYKQGEIDIISDTYRSMLSDIRKLFPDSDYIQFFKLLKKALISNKKRDFEKLKETYYNIKDNILVDISPIFYPD